MVTALNILDLRNGLKHHRSALVYAILATICVAPIVTVCVYWSARVFPYWTDAGMWLKYVNAMVGRDYPMWGDKSFQIDQLYFLSLEFTRLLLRDDLLALKITALVAYAIRPATTFVLARKLFNSDLAAGGAALLSGFQPFFYEALGWGGYPNLLGFAVLPLVFYGIIRVIEERSAKNIGFLGLLTAVTVFSHNLTFMVFVGALVLWLLMALLSRARGSKHAQKQLFAVGFCLGIVMLLVVLQLYTIGLPSYDIFNSAAFYQLRVSFGDLVWAVKDLGLAVYFVFVTAACLVGMHFTKRNGVRIMAMVSWIAAPLLMSQVYLLGLTTDYRRVFFFMLQPSLIVIAAPLAFSAILFRELRHVSIARDGSSPYNYIRKAARSLPTLVLLALSISFIVTQVGIGMTFPRVVNDWYNQADPYGDIEKLQALGWIKYNTQTRDVFVADEVFGRWTEGYASRRVLMYELSQYLFMKGETQRSLAARTILECRFELRNDFARICYQAPHGSFTPSISFNNEGAYEDALYLNDMDTRIYVSNGTYSWPERLSEFAESGSSQSYVLSGGGSLGVLKADYARRGIILSKQIMLTDRAVTSVRYDVSTYDSSLRVSNLTISIFPPPGSFFSEVYAESASTIHARSGSIGFHVTASGQILEARLLNSEVGKILALSFEPQSNAQSVSATVTVSAEIQGSNSVLTIDRDDVIRQFDVSYVVIPRLSYPEDDGIIPLRRSTIAYDHLLTDPALEVAYENSKVIVLRVVSLGPT